MPTDMPHLCRTLNGDGGVVSVRSWLVGCEISRSVGRRLGVSWTYGVHTTTMSCDVTLRGDVKRALEVAVRVFCLDNVDDDIAVRSTDCAPCLCVSVSGQL